MDEEENSAMTYSAVVPPISPDDLSGPYPKHPLTLSVQETAKMLGVSEKTVRTAIDKGQIEAVKIGRMVRIIRKSLLEHLGMSDD